MIMWLVSWLIYGLIVGALAKWLHPGNDEPVGLVNTVAIGVAGSYLGGFLNYVIFGHGSPFSPSGIIMGVIGAVLLLVIYGWVQNRAK